jgi:long-chain fatty acid transport protein
MRTLRVFLAVAGFVLASAAPVLAEGFALYEWSARGIALGGATVAREPDASTVAYNPALMTKLHGIHIQGGFSAITPDGRMQTTSGGVTQSTTLKPATWVVPHLYYTQQLSDRWFVGVGEFSRFGLGFEYPHNWPGRQNVYQVKLNTASINPNVAWKATDNLSLAAGVEFVYVKLDLKKRTVLPNPAWEIDSDIQDAEDVSPGFNLAAHYQFNDQWAAGLSYRSQTKVRAWGDVDFNDVNGNIPGPVYNAAVKDGTAHAEVVFPDSVAGGVSFTPIPELSFEVGATWTRWSTFRSLRIHIPQTIANPEGISESKKMWDDAWRLNAGVEWKALDWMTLRAGYIWDQSPMTEEYEDYLVPTDGRNMYSVGVGFQYDAWTLDLAYAYIDAKGRSYSSNTETHVLDSKAKSTRTDIVSMTLGYEF